MPDERLSSGWVSRCKASSSRTRCQPERHLGLSASNKFCAWVRSAFPVLRYTLDDMIAEGDKGLVRWTWRCTHKGDFNRIAPIGKQVIVTGMALYRIAGGKCVFAVLHLKRETF